MKRTSIRFRLMILMICVAAFPVITLTWIATSNMRNSIEKEIINANNSRMMWAVQYLNELNQQLNALFYSLQIDQDLIDGLNEIESSDISMQYRAQNYIRNTLTAAFYANSRKIDELTIYIHSSKKAILVNFTHSGMTFPLDIRNSLWDRILNESVNIYFDESGRDIYAFHSINHFNNKELIGGIGVRIKRDVWEELSNILKSESESSIFLINDEGKILSTFIETEISDEIQAWLQHLNVHNSTPEYFKTKNYIFFIKQINGGQLKVVKVIPLEIISRSTSTTVTAGVLIGILFTFASILLSIIVSLKISRPIISLAKTMMTAQVQNFGMKTVESYDEIGILKQGYYSMMQRIKELIEVQYQQTIELKNAQLMALQAQINPHFLTNTLNLIGGMALLKKAPEIYKMTEVVGNLLRYSTSLETNMIFFQDEIKHIRNYVFIQEQRFTERCTVIFSVDENVLDSRLPKFSLQPIVENAFEHGFRGKEGLWSMEIRVKCIGNRICFIVKDNGVGIEKGRLCQIRTELKASTWTKFEEAGHRDIKNMKGIGLKNVNARVKLKFGKKYGIRIFSRAGAGTLVVLVLPISKLEVEKSV